MTYWDDPMQHLFNDNPSGYNPDGSPFYYREGWGGGPEALGHSVVRSNSPVPARPPEAEPPPPADGGLMGLLNRAKAAKEAKEAEPPPPNYSEALTRAAGPGMFARFTKAPIKPSTPVSWQTFAERGDRPDPASPAAAAVGRILAKDGDADIGATLRGTMQGMRNEREARVAPLKKVTFNDLRAQQNAMFGQGPIAGSGARGVANSVASMFGAPSGGAPSSPPSSSSVAAMFAAPPGGAPPPSSGGGGLFDPATISAMAPPPPRPKMTDAEARALGVQASQMRADQSAMYGAPPPPNPQLEALKRSQQAMYSTPILGKR